MVPNHEDLIPTQHNLNNNNNPDSDRNSSNSNSDNPALFLS